jgi:hypothetical protein
MNEWIWSVVGMILKGELKYWEKNLFSASLFTTWTGLRLNLGFNSERLLNKHLRCGRAWLDMALAVRDNAACSEVLNISTVLQGRNTVLPLSLTDTYIEISGNGTLPCVATGEPSPHISWTRKDGKQLNKSRIGTTEHGSLQITCKSLT